MKAILHLNGKEVKDGKINLKNCPIYNGEMSENKRLSHLTEKGYYSKKPLYVDFATTNRVKTAPSGNKYIELTDAEYNYLDNNFTTKGKVFQTYEQRKRTENACRVLAWCSVMKDPYDRG